MSPTDALQTGEGRAGLHPPLEAQNHTLCRDASVGGNSEYPMPGAGGRVLPVVVLAVQWFAGCAQAEGTREGTRSTSLRSPALALVRTHIQNRKNLGLEKQ